MSETATIATPTAAPAPAPTTTTSSSEGVTSHVDNQTLTSSQETNKLPALEVSPSLEEGIEKPNDKFASRFAALTRKEKETRLREKALKEREAKLAELEETESLLQSNPLEYLKRKNLTYKQLTDLILNDGKVPVEAKLEALEKKLTEKEESEKARALKEAEDAQTQAVERFRAECASVLETEGDAYEYCKFHGEDAVDLMYAVTEEHYEKTKRILSPKEAADFVEKYLEDRAEKLTSLKKLKSKLTTPQNESVPGSDEESLKLKENGQKADYRPTTLTNQQQTANTPKEARALTEQELIEHVAANVLRWEK